jgi:two-component system, NarL family, sensor histidine kinase DesK
MHTQSLPASIKLTYIIAMLVLLCFAAFIIMAVWIYNKKQGLMLAEQKAQEALYANSLLQKELDAAKQLQHERERIAQDMHDDVGSNLSAIKLHAEFLKMQQLPNADLDEIINYSTSINISIKEMIWSLNAGNDYLDSFTVYVLQYAKNYFAKSNIKLSTNSIGIADEVVMNSETRRNLFLSIKEALHNIIKHSQATEASLQIDFNNPTLIITIADNGIGITTTNTNGNGLINMHKRMHNIGGTYSSSNNRGTQIVLTSTLRQDIYTT